MRVVVVALAIVIAAVSARAESQAAIAARSDREGHALLVKGKADTAIPKFQDAFARVPEALYAFHLCEAYDQLKHVDEAIAACTAAKTASNPKRSAKDRELARLIDLELTRLRNRAGSRTPARG